MVSCIRHPVTCINQGFSNAYKAAEDATSKAIMGVQNGYNRAVVHVKNGVQAGAQAINDAFKRLIDATIDFIYRNCDTLFYLGCVAALTTFSPNLFIPATLATLVIRIESTRRLKQVANEYLKEEKNPFNQPGPGRAIISTIDIALAGIAALNSIALGTVFRSSYLTPHLLPLVGGIAVGSSLAKLVIKYVEKKANERPIPTAPTAPQTPLANRNPVVIEVRPLSVNSEATAT